MSSIEESLANQEDTILDTNNVECVCSNSSENQDETILDTDGTDNSNDSNNHNNDGLDGLGDFGKKLTSLFASKDMQSSLTNAMNSIVNQMKNKFPTMPNVDASVLLNNMLSHEEIMNDINTRVVPHLLSCVGGTALCNVKSININEKEKSYSTISMLYNVSTHLINNGYDKEEVIRHRDSLVGVYAWTSLYDRNNFYGTPNEEISNVFNETLMGCTTGMLNMGLSAMSGNNLSTMFAQLQSSNISSSNNTESEENNNVLKVNDTELSAISGKDLENMINKFGSLNLN
jgi:hypothetical protein